METTRDPNSNEYYYDTLTRPNVRKKTYFSWVPLLLIPLFFVFGWVTKGAYDAPRSGVNSPQYGVGGGPGDVTPYPAGYVVSPTPVSTPPSEDVVTPSVYPSVDSEVQDTNSPTPSATSKVKATLSPSASAQD